MSVLKLEFLIKYSLLFLVTFSTPCYARWATFADAPVETIFYNREIQINADGTASETIETKIKLLNQSGRDQRATQIFTYNTDNVQMKILAAKSVYNDKEYPLDLKLVEDKPLASNINGFDQINQILLAYPHAEVGAELYLKYTLVHTKAYPSNFFSTLFFYGDDGSYWDASKVTVTSALPFFLNINDPEQYLDIKQNNANQQYTLEINLLRPVYKHIIDESHNSFNPNKVPAISLSTMNDWEKFGRLIATDYTKTTTQELPKIYQKIALLAKQATTLYDKINIITSLLNDKIQYMGDWRTIEGKLIPRDFALVASSRQGDCKDYASATVAILRYLGINTASVALINRGEGNYALPFTQPAHYHFNHAIVHLKQADGSDLWIDPTNHTSMAGNIYPDIANKQALVLAVDHTKLIYTPEVNFSANKVIITKNVKFVDKKTAAIAEVNGSINLQQQAALPFTGSSKYASIQSLQNSILRNVSSSYDQTMDVEVIMPDLSSRVVSDLEFKYHFKERNLAGITNAGSGIEVRTPYVHSFIVHEDAVADLYIDNPATIDLTLNLDNVLPMGKENLDYSLSSRWLDVTRRVVYAKNNISVKQIIKIKQRLISNEDLKTAEYQKMQQEIAQNLRGVIGIIFKAQ